MVLKQKRGNYQVWRMLLERKELIAFTIRERHHKYTEFIFCGLFF